MAGVGDLVATLSVNNAPWSKGLSSAKSQFSSFAGGISSAIAPLVGVIAGVWGAGESVKAYSESLAQARKLEAVLQATGGAAGLTGQQIADYAGELQSMTNFEDDATIGAAAALAAFTNIRGETFFSAIDAAADLSAVMGGDLESNVKLVGKALNDPVDGLAKLARAGVQFTQSQKDQIEALQKSGDLLGAQGIILDVMSNKFGGAAKATADPMTQLQNTIGDVAENIGSLLVPSLNVGAEYLTSLLSIVVDGGDTFKTFGIEAAVQLSHIGSYVLLAATQFELAFVQIGAEASHFFTESLPAYFSWFQDNALNIAQTFATNYIKIYENMGKNISSILGEVWGYISSGGTDAINVTFTSLSDGFINTIGNLPDVPARVVGDYEKSLAASIDAQAETIGESMAEQRKKLEEQFSPLKTIASGTAGDVTDLSKQDKEKAFKDKGVDVSASLSGSQDAAKVFLRGLGGNKVDKQIKVAEQTLVATNRVADAIESFEPMQVEGSNA